MSDIRINFTMESNTQCLTINYSPYSSQSRWLFVSLPYWSWHHFIQHSRSSTMSIVDFGDLNPLFVCDNASGKSSQSLSHSRTGSNQSKDDDPYPICYRSLLQVDRVVTPRRPAWYAPTVLQILWPYHYDRLRTQLAFNSVSSWPAWHCLTVGFSWIVRILSACHVGGCLCVTSHSNAMK